MADTKISDLAAVTDVLSTDEYVLARSGATNKITAVDLGAGLSTGGSTILNNMTLGSPGAMDFTGISGAYNHLRVVLWARSNVAATNDNIFVRLNNDSGSNYDYQFLQNYAGTGGQQEGIATTSWQLATSVPGATSPTDAASSMILDLPFYAETTFRKTGIMTSSVALFDTSQGQRLWWSSGEWRSTAAITRVTITCTSGAFVTGSRAILYGIT